MKNLGITYKDIEKNEFDILYIDFQPSTTVEDFKTPTFASPMTRSTKEEDYPNVVVGPSTSKKHFVLDKIEDTSTVEEFFKKKIAEKFNSIADIENITSTIGTVSKENINRLGNKIAGGSYYIANEGRCGPGDTLILNTNTHDAYLKDKYEELNLSFYEIIINDFIPDNEIIINRKPNVTNAEPGYYIFSNTDKDGQLYASLCDLGYFPEKQVFRLRIK